MPVAQLDENLSIPLTFWFNSNARLALPMASIPYSRRDNDENIINNTTPIETNDNYQYAPDIFDLAIIDTENENENDVICGICRDSIMPIYIKTLSCHPTHLFHNDCIDSWLLRNSSCPICRVQIERSNAEILNTRAIMYNIDDHQLVIEDDDDDDDDESDYEDYYLDNQPNQNEYSEIQRERNERHIGGQSYQINQSVTLPNLQMEGQIVIDNRHYIDVNIINNWLLYDHQDFSSSIDESNDALESISDIENLQSNNQSNSFNNTHENFTNEIFRYTNNIGIPPLRTVNIDIGPFVDYNNSNWLSNSGGNSQIMTSFEPAFNNNQNLRIIGHVNLRSVLDNANDSDNNDNEIHTIEINYNINRGQSPL